MTDAQYLFDLARQQYNEAADGLERHFEKVATQLKDWIPQQIRQTPPPPPPPRRLIPASYWQSVHRWVSKNTAISAGIAAFVGTGAVLLFIQRTAHLKKRRARRSNGGARTEVVVIAGSPNSSITTTALALDLERRGFIVYIITSSAEDEQHVRNQSRVDLLPLSLDLIHPSMAQEQISRFGQFLSRHHHAFNGASAHSLVLSGIIIIPDTSAAIEPVSAIPPEAWSTALNAKVLNTILIAQSLSSLATEFQSRVLFLTPSIVPSLRPPYHSVQSTVSGALEAFIGTLAAELGQSNVPVCHFKLGNIEAPGSKHRKDDNHLIKGTPMRKLHDSVFDALHAKTLSRTWHVGKGSLIYHVLGGWMPSSLVWRMMGITQSVQATDEVSTQEAEEDQNARSIEWEKVEQSP